jgi:hypothetical protein
MRFEILMAVNMFWVVTPSGLVDRYKSFGRTYCLHLLLNRKTSSISKIQYGFNFFMHVIWICCWMMWLIMLMAWDISERRPMGLLFIPQVIREHGGPWRWWNQLGKTPDSSTRALWQSYQQRHLGVRRRNARRSWKFALSVSDIWQQIFNMQ